MSSTLDLTGEEDPVIGLGHGTAALGPSDTSDSGSDIVGGPGMDEGLDDDQSREIPFATTQGAGRDIGDGTLVGDSDGTGTGERGASGPDVGTANDQTFSVHDGPGDDADAFDDTDLAALSDSTNDPELAAEKKEDDADEADVSDGAT